LRPLAEALRQVADGGQKVAMEQIGPVDPRFRPMATPPGEKGCLDLVGSLPHHEALERMAAADVLVLIQPDNTLQIPGKLYEMLSFRKPILTLAGPGATADVIREYGVGVVVDPKNPDEIADGIRWAASEPGRSEAATGFEAALTAFDGRALTGRLAEEFNAAAGR
jgi:glycosyltransferase involved in cell wall biosynthesis